MQKLTLLIILLLFVQLSFAQEVAESLIYEPLTIREPSLGQLEAYLIQFPPFSDGSDYVPDHWESPFSWYETNALQYIDLNGDDELDLVAHGYIHIAVMVWLDDRYSEPFQLYNSGGPRNPFSKVELEDWTLDGIPEVIFHKRRAHSGSDIGGDVFEDTVIHCTEAKCKAVWSEEVADYVNLYSMDARLIQQTHVSRHTDDTNVPQVKTISTEFAYASTPGCAIDIDFVLANRQTIDSFNQVGDVVQKIYEWNGITFQLTREETLSKFHNIDMQLQYITVNNNQDVAYLGTKSVNVDYFWKQFDECQLIVNGEKFDTSFICNQAYISWKDITGDGNDELVIEAYAGLSGVQEDEKECAHQRLIAYQQRDNTFIQIANVTGCLVQIDMFGIQLDNIDDDSALELIVADDVYTDYEIPPCFGGYCWYEPNFTNEIYDWTGRKYSLSHTVPREPYQP